VTAERKPVKNVDLWQRLETAAQRHQVEWIWVKGHAGHPGNERADALANRGMLDAVAQNGPRTTPQQARDSSTRDSVDRERAADPQARCVHDLIRAQCWECRSQRAKLPDRVAVTSGGSVFHLADHCEALNDGWRQISRRGGTPSELVWVPTADALAEGRGGCEVCCAHLDLT
jgi:hypothetical protein